MTNTRLHDYTLGLHNGSPFSGTCTHTTKATRTEVVLVRSTPYTNIVCHLSLILWASFSKTIIFEEKAPTNWCKFIILIQWLYGLARQCLTLLYPQLPLWIQPKSLKHPVPDRVKPSRTEINKQINKSIEPRY